MFYDRAKIYIRSGNGGDGMISFRREKHVPRGGPDGGNGGSGGDIIFTVNPHKSTLVHFYRNNHFRAADGKHGGAKKMQGADGQALIIEVPAGTTIRNSETNELMADLTREDQEALLLSGGQGGRGNASYATSTNQAPRLAMRGEPGTELWLDIELKLIADVGIVGVPNAGKSTLLSVVSAARPKIADYPFTTLQPNLGVVQLDNYESFVLADIPGLIEGASHGIGLGHDFLRHIERTKVLIHLLDGGSLDPLIDWAMINQELALYDARLEQKPQLVVLNKIDLEDSLAWQPLVEERMVNEVVQFCAISAVTGLGVRQMLFAVKELLDSAGSQAEFEPAPAIIKPDRDEDAFTVERTSDGWRVSGIKIERIAAMTYWEFEAPVRKFQQVLEKMGITKALQDAGVSVGDTVTIGDETLEWSD